MKSQILLGTLALAGAANAGVHKCVLSNVHVKILSKGRIVH